MELSAPEILGLAIKRLQHRNQRALDARLAPLGISVVQWNALREIERCPGLCMHALAEQTFNSDQAFGTLMARLRRQKLVERQPGAGRANVHHLTARGKTLLGEGRKRVRHVLARAFAPLDAEECARLRALLTKLHGGKNPDLAPCASVTAHHPVTRFAKTLVGIVPEPGRPLVHPGRHLHKKGSGHAPTARSRKANPATGGAN